VIVIELLLYNLLNNIYDINDINIPLNSNLTEFDTNIIELLILSKSFVIDK